MGVLNRVATRVEAMVDPAVEITQHFVQASIDLASSGLRFVDRELGYLQREMNKGAGRSGTGRSKKR